MTSNNSHRFGPNNPHPLSTLKTELIWDGKYDEYGSRREIDIASFAMPLQKIETIDEPRSRIEAQGKLFDSKQSHHDDFRNMLIWGDNKLIISSLLRDYRGKIDLIYIDPPFDVGQDFTMNIPLGDEETIAKDQSTLELVAYSDMWGKGTDSYLHMMYERLALIRLLLNETGTVYVHSDWHVGHYLKCILVDLFGKENFINEITWYYYNKFAPESRCFPRASDRILSFAKSFGKHKFYKQEEKREKPVKQLVRRFVGGKAINVRNDQGEVQYQEKDTRRIDDVWRIPMLQPADKTEYLAFNTQKPEVLLERMIMASSDPGDLIADFFCGSGTTGSVAERLGRRWIMADLGRFAIHTSRKRLIEVQRTLHAEGQVYRAFDVYNLGRYERQWWQREHLKGADYEHRKVVLGFYKAEILNSSVSPLLHGRKGRAFVHVDSIDSVFTRVELRDVANAAKEAGGEQVNCLAWEFEMDLRLEVHKLSSELGIEIRLLRIPREIMEKNRNQVTFFEVATLEAEPIYSGKGKEKQVNIKLTKFLPSLAEVPEKELEALKERALNHGFDFIDFWAVDFDYRQNQPFKHHWQAYRTRKDRSLRTVSDQNFVYARTGKYIVCVKVVDTFGCDTSITVQVDIN